MAVGGDGEICHVSKHSEPDAVRPKDRVKRAVRSKHPDAVVVAAEVVIVADMAGHHNAAVGGDGDARYASELSCLGAMQPKVEGARAVRVEYMDAGVETRVVAAAVVVIVAVVGHDDATVWGDGDAGYVSG